MGKKTNLAIVGIGHVAKFQLEALKCVDGLELIAACDTDPSKAVALPNGVRFYDDVTSMLELNGIEAVLVAVPNKEHYSVARQVLDAGKDILLEKPATSTLDEFDSLYAKSRRMGTLLVIAFHAAFARDLLWFKASYLRELRYKLGPISSFCCGFYDPYILDGNLLPAALNLGGSWIDSGINALSVIGQLISVDSLKTEEVRLTA